MEVGELPSKDIIVSDTM